jgi:hypothetical protein
MFHVKHFRRLFVGKSYILDPGGLRQTSLKRKEATGMVASFVTY